MSRKIRLHGYIEIEIQEAEISDYAAWQEVEGLLDQGNHNILGRTDVRIADYQLACTTEEEHGVTWTTSFFEHWKKLLFGDGD